jgi:hypothetical protein
MRRLFSVLILLGAGAAAWAHHSFAAAYDMQSPVTVHGVISQVLLRNPHSWFVLDVKDANGKVTSWRFEGSSVAIVQRTGTKRADLVNNIGQTVIVGACPGKGGVPRGAAEKVKLPDGREIIVARQRFYGETGGAPPAKDDQ